MGMSTPQAVRENQRIILFDGVCNLCSALLNVVYANDKKALFRYAWVQSRSGKEILEWCGLPTDFYDTMVYIENATPYFKSTALLKIARSLRFPWPLLSAGLIVPKFIRDWLYDRIALNRYKIFGRKKQCLLPSGKLTKRFL
jgi:predicted DCC family thiol-disulfide oxidoreductase YuxK